MPVAMQRRTLGSTGAELSVLGFGGVIVTNTPQATADRYVAEAFERGVTYFDVAPFYGNAQERLGPALQPYRDRCFLACKSKERTGDGIRRELEESLRLLKTDHFDLYQLHGILKVEEDVDAAFAPGGAVEAVIKARDAGKARFIGFSAHTEEAALAAMDRFDFDSVMFPFNYFTWTHGNFGHRVYERARAKGMGIIALKSIAHRPWSKEEFQSFFRPWHKCWYKPLEERDKIELALRFTLNLPVDAAIPPGHWDLFKTCLDVVESGVLGAVSENELGTLERLASDSKPLFQGAAA